MSTLPGWSDGWSGPWLAKLGDTEPIDLAISCCFLLSLVAIAVAVTRPRLQASERLRWIAVGAVIAVLFVNQQGDFHTRLMAEARATLDTVETVLGRSITLDDARGGLALGAVSAVLFVIAISLRGRPPGRWAGAGLLMLLFHATVRAAIISGIIGDGPAPDALRLALKATEVAGLALVLLGAITWRAALPREPAAVPSSESRPMQADEPAPRSS